MRLSTRVAVLCVGLFVSHQAAAADLPQRWVSAGGALSEWVTALGGESKLVGVDTTSQHPESLKALPSIGYQRSLSAEGILSLRPDILIGTEEMGPPPVLSQVKAAKVQVELFSAQPDLPTLEKNVTHLGQLLGAEAAGHAIAAKLSTATRRAKSAGCSTRSPNKKRRACCCCSGMPVASR